MFFSKTFEKSNFVIKNQDDPYVPKNRNLGTEGSGSYCIPKIEIWEQKDHLDLLIKMIPMNVFCEARTPGVSAWAWEGTT